MTISASGPSFVQLPGNGSGTIFSFPMKVFAASDVLVGFIPTSGAYVLQTSGYTVANIDVNGGGSVVFTTAPPSGTLVDIRTSTPLTQGTEFANLGAYLPENTTDALDRATRQIQDVYRQTYQFGIHGPDQESIPWPALPGAAQRANQGLVFDSNGLPVPGVLTTQPLTAGLVGSFFYPPTAAETNANITPNTAFAAGDPRRYGAVGNGTGDDSLAIANCILCNQVVNFPGTGFNFQVLNTMEVTAAGTQINGNGSTITIGAAFTINTLGQLLVFDITANHVTIQGLAFANLAAGVTSPPITAQNSLLRFNAGCNFGGVYNCQFTAWPDTAPFQCTVGFMQGTSHCTAAYNTYDGCGIGFSQGSKSTFAFNTCRNPVDASIAINSQSCLGAVIVGNVISNDSGRLLPGMITVEEGPSGWVIADNYLSGVTGVGISCLNIAVTTVVNGGIIANNYVDGSGLSTTNPGALIGVSQYYQGVQVINNFLIGVNVGNNNNAAVLISALGNVLRGNHIDASTGTSNIAAIIVTLAHSSLDIVDNYINNVGGSRAITFNAGDNSSARTLIKGNQFVGGSVAVDASLNTITNSPIWFENNESNAGTFYNPQSSDSLSRFFNSAHALDHPNFIRAGRSVYGDIVPTAGTWALGDTVYNIAPAASGVFAWVCVTAGAPGTWKTIAVGA